MSQEQHRDERATPRQIFVEPWAPEYGSPNQIDSTDEDENLATLPEGEHFEFVAPTTQGEPSRVAFVDGRRRVEALLSQWVDDQAVAGLAGAYAVGAVAVEPGCVPVFVREQVHRVAIWSQGRSGELPPVAGGWSWKARSTPESGPMAPLRKLQDSMRDAEADLARELAAEGYQVLTDGTLWFPTGVGNERIAGYVKTHHRRLLANEFARQLPDLPTGHRTSLFTTGRRYTCYVRLADRHEFHAPLSAIIRLEFSSSLPLEDVRGMADRFTAMLPVFGGVAHVDPRAPQNLQPVSALEARLSHLFGDAGLALRAVRESVTLL